MAYQIVAEVIAALQALPPTAPIKANNVTIQTITKDANGTVQLSNLPNQVEAD